MKRRVAVTLIALVALGGATVPISGCGKGNPTHFSKTKFVLHAGLAFGAFHQFIYNPLKAGQFNPPLQHKATIVKAGVAGLFVVHELNLALADARADKTLSKLVAPITALQTKISGLASGLKSGKLDQAGISSAGSDVTNLGSQAQQAGASVKDRLVPIPGT